MKCYQDKYLEAVKSIHLGDRITTKSACRRKYNLPFGKRGHMVSVMAIKAIGVVKENIDDGRRGITHENLKKIVCKFTKFLGVNEAVDLLIGS